MSMALFRLAIILSSALWVVSAQAQIGEPGPDQEIEIAPPALPETAAPPETSVLGDQPDYSRLTREEEKRVRLERLFEKLKSDPDPETGELTAEEIWAQWLDSGSASINLLVRRGTAAQRSGDLDLARRMFDRVTLLEPDYAEGWSRSGRLALEEEDLNRAVVDIKKALILEPRHFYALWTLGNIMERLGRSDAAFEAYREANQLYPQLKAVKDRLDSLRTDVEGDVL